MDLTEQQIKDIEAIIGGDIEEMIVFFHRKWENKAVGTIKGSINFRISLIEMLKEDTAEHMTDHALGINGHENCRHE